MIDYVNLYFRGKSFPYPRIVCADGFSMSVQGGEYLYSEPRADVDYYTKVEVGFPSERVEAFMPYIDEDDSDPTQTVYGYVPVDVVNRVISAHGLVVEFMKKPEVKA